MMIMAYSFEITLSENANFTISNVNNCVFSIGGVWNYVHVCLHFGIILRYNMVSKMLMKYGGMMFRDFFQETA